MKSTFIQIIFAFCFVSITYAHVADAQTDLSYKVNLSVQDESLLKVLKLIEKQAKIP